MSKHPFEHAEFHRACITPETFPNLRNSRGQTLPEIAIVGRSNVGKSSLINHLLRKKIAKTSSKPGKTQTLNFFIVDDNFLLVDLPGFGYAKVSKEMREAWGQTVTQYLSERSALKGIVHLMDARRQCNEDDIGFMQWCFEQGKDYILVLTKCDEVSADDVEKKLSSILNAVQGIVPLEKDQCVAYTIQSDKGRKALIPKILKIIKDD